MDRVSKFPSFWIGQKLIRQGVLRLPNSENTPSHGLYCADLNGKLVFLVPPFVAVVPVVPFDEIDYIIKADKGTYYFGEPCKIYPRAPVANGDKPELTLEAFQASQISKEPMAELPKLAPIDVTTQGTLHGSRRGKFYRIYLGKKELEKLKKEHLNLQPYVNRRVEVIIKHAGGDSGLGGFRDRRHRYA